MLVPSHFDYLWRAHITWTHPRSYPKAKFLVSHGSIDLAKWKSKDHSDRYPSRLRIDDIETLLILASSGNSKMINKRKHRSHGIVDHYEITNHGPYQPLPKRILLTVTVDRAAERRPDVAPIQREVVKTPSNDRLAP